MLFLEKSHARESYYGCAMVFDIQKISIKKNYFNVLTERGLDKLERTKLLYFI